MLRATAARKKEAIKSSSAASGRCGKGEICGALPTPYKPQYFENAVSGAAASEASAIAPKFEAISVKIAAVEKQVTHPIADTM